MFIISLLTILFFLTTMPEDHLKWPYLKTYFEKQLTSSDKTEKKIEFYIQMHAMLNEYGTLYHLGVLI
jgi:hypothetical protein